MEIDVAAGELQKLAAECAADPGIGERPDDQPDTGQQAKARQGRHIEQQQREQAGGGAGHGDGQYRALCGHGGDDGCGVGLAACLLADFRPAAHFFHIAFEQLH